MKKLSIPNSLYLTSIGIAIVLLFLVVLAVDHTPADARSSDKKANQQSGNGQKSTTSVKSIAVKRPSNRVTVKKPVVENSRKKTSSNKPRKKDVKVAQLAKLAPIFQRYSQKQSQALNQYVGTLNDHLFHVYRNVQTDDFAEELHSFQAMGKAWSDNASKRTYLTQRFKQHVVDIDSLQSVIENQLIALNRAFIKNDNELLIACGVDSDFDPEKLGLLNPNVSGLANEFNQSLPELQNLLEKAFATNAIATAGGIVAGDTAGKLGYELGKDQNGEATLASMLLGGIFAIAADAATDEITRQVFQTKSQINDEAMAIGRRTIAPLLFAKKKPAPTWLDIMARQRLRHVNQCRDLITNEFGLKSGSLK